MANADAPFGFLPTRMVNGSPYCGQTLACCAVTGNAEAMFVGTPVTFEGGAYTFPEGDSLPTIKLATVATSNPILGCIIGFEPNRDDLTQKHRAASTLRRIYVAVATPDVVFRAQSDGATLLADVGKLGTFTGVSGSTTTGYSNAEWDDSEAADTVNQWKLIGFWDSPDNEPGDVSTNPVVLVTPSHPDIGSGRLTLGV